MRNARKSMLCMRLDPAAVCEEPAEIQAIIDLEKAIKASANFMNIWRDPVDRRRTLLAIAAVSTQAASGAMFMIDYGTYFFQIAKIGKPFVSSCILTTVGAIAIVLNSCTISKIGRRRLFLMSGLSLCGICHIAVAAVYHFDPGTASTGKAIVGLSILYIVGYNGMIAAYTWLSGGEIPSQRLRSYTFSIAVAVGFAGAWLATFIAPYFINPDALNWVPEYGSSCFVTVAWVYFHLPEIKNRTLEEIDEMFDAKLSARQFRKYVCFGRNVGARRRSSASVKDGVMTHNAVSVEKTG